MLCCSGDATINHLLIQAAQMHETSKEGGDNSKIIDNLLLQVSQEVENQLVKYRVT